MDAQACTPSGATRPDYPEPLGKPDDSTEADRKRWAHSFCEALEDLQPLTIQGIIRGYFEAMVLIGPPAPANSYTAELAVK